MKLAMRLLVLLGWTVIFWNVENFFDPSADTSNPSERSFSADGDRRWTAGRFKTKARAIAKVVLALSDSTGTPPDIVCLCEVENARCLREITGQPAMRKYGYRFVHYDSPDPRGIDCALLYRSAPGVGRLLESRSMPVRDSLGAVLPTRALLLAEFDSLAVIVCHLPSKRGGSATADRRRSLALSALSRMCDSVRTAAPGRLLIALGDFNDIRTPASDSVMAPMRELSASGAPGSLKFEGRWEQIDRAFVSDTSAVALRIAAPPCLTAVDKKYGGTKPLRTFSGPRYLGGVSDHYPIILSSSRRRR